MRWTLDHFLPVRSSWSICLVLPAVSHQQFLIRRFSLPRTNEKRLVYGNTRLVSMNVISRTYICPGYMLTTATWQIKIFFSLIICKWSHQRLFINVVVTLNRCQLRLRGGPTRSRDPALVITIHLHVHNLLCSLDNCMLIKMKSC